MSERRTGTSLVSLDREPVLLDADAVVSDNQQGAVNAMSHLIEQGHRRIAYLGDRVSVATAAQRFQGYTRALELAQIGIDDELIDPPTALFASQNLVTIGVSRALRNLGLPDCIALVGFDDFPLADMLRPGISVIAQDSERLGTLAAEILFRRLDGDASPTRTHVVPTRLVARGSGEISPRSARRG